MSSKEEKKKRKGGIPEVGTGGLVTGVTLGLRRNMFRCLLANPGSSVPATVKGVIEMSIWPTRSRARIDLSKSLVERGASVGVPWS